MEVLCANPLGVVGFVQSRTILRSSSTFRLMKSGDARGSWQPGAYALCQSRPCADGKWVRSGPTEQAKVLPRDVSVVIPCAVTYTAIRHPPETTSQPSGTVDDRAQ